MQRDNFESPAELIELGTASMVTQGPGGIYIEHEGWDMRLGLSDD